MIEAMACGTPIIAFRSGSVPEVIDGVTGFVVEDEEQAVQAVRRLSELDRKRVRKRFEERFTAERMAAEHVSHYQSVANGGSVQDRGQRLPAPRCPQAPTNEQPITPMSENTVVKMAAGKYPAAIRAQN